MSQNSNNVFYENIETNTIENTFYRKVVYTGKMQFVYMSIKPLDSIKMEVHQDHDQFFRIEKGTGEAIVNGKNYKLYDGIGLIVPAGAQHQIINTSENEDLKLYSIYTPPEHKPDRLDINNPDNPDKLKQKYLKYKQKYLQIKNKK
jgi:mannose-6-phosphate isomerase-like protein (cupin superfamily)